MLCFVGFGRLRRSGSPSWRPLQTQKLLAYLYNEVHSLSLALLGSSLREGAKGASHQGRQGHFVPAGAKGALRLRAAKSRPYGWRCKTNRYTPFIVPHPLSFAFAQQLPQRWSQGGSAAAGTRACKLSRR